MGASSAQRTRQTSRSSSRSSPSSSRSRSLLRDVLPLSQRDEGGGEGCRRASPPARLHWRLGHSIRAQLSPHAAATDPAAAACTVASPSLPRADLVRSRLLVRLGRAVCLRVWSGVDVAHLTSRALCLSRWHNAVMRARDHIAAPRGCVVPQFVGVSEWLNSFVVYLISRN